MNKILFGLLIALPASMIMGMEKYNSIETLVSDLRTSDFDKFKAVIDASPGLVKLVDKNGMMLLHHSIEVNQPEKMKYLLEKGAAPDAISQDGKNGLHYAAKVANQEAVYTLLSKKVNVREQDNEGTTPLHILARNKHEKEYAPQVAMTVNALLYILDKNEYFRDYDLSLLLIEDNQKKTPIDLALDRSNWPALAMFFERLNNLPYNSTPEITAQNQKLGLVRQTLLNKFLKDENQLAKLLEGQASMFYAWFSQQRDLLEKKKKTKKKLLTLEKAVFEYFINRTPFQEHMLEHVTKKLQWLESEEKEQGK